MNRRRLPARHGAPFAAALCALVGAAGAQAQADEAAYLGLTLNPVIGGQHESFDDRIRVPPVPIPLFELRARSGSFELDLEGLPALASVRSSDSTQGHTSTVLSVFDGIARVWDRRLRWSAGIGQTVYNQTTHYTDVAEPGGIGQTQFSRVTGLTYQAGYGIRLGRGRFEASFNFTPVMLGTQVTAFNVASDAPLLDPERAEQIDTAVRYTYAARPHGQLILGLRYINYTASYTPPRGGLSDRNVGLLPTVGYRLRLGR